MVFHEFMVAASTKSEADPFKCSATGAFVDAFGSSATGLHGVEGRTRPTRRCADPHAIGPRDRAAADRQAGSVIEGRNGGRRRTRSRSADARRGARSHHRLPGHDTEEITCRLDPWPWRAKPSLLASFVNGVDKDRAAVSAAISSQWSNGQTTNLKLVKRQMYDCGKLDLLQARVIGAP